MSHFPLQHVTEYVYNGLNWRITWHYDTDNDQDVDANDKTYAFVYDERWRPVATFREDDSDPKEQFVYHAAGNDGRGTASYIDDVILRDRDANTDWDVQADGTLEERFYYCQNWRHDVVALLDANGAGQQVEQVRYEAYGMPYVVVAGDVDVSGKIDSADTAQIQSWIDTSTYNVLGDVDLDGDVDATDKSIVSSDPAGGGNRGELTHGVHANRKGYAGYEFDDTISHESYHVRHQVLNSELGQWMNRASSQPSSYTYLLLTSTRRRNQECVAECRDDLRVQTLLEQIAVCQEYQDPPPGGLDDPEDFIWSRISCKEDCDGNCGDYTPSPGEPTTYPGPHPGEICIDQTAPEGCPGHVGATGYTICDTLVEELAHMLQFCKYRRRYGSFDDALDAFRTLQSCICTEIDAKSLWYEDCMSDSIDPCGCCASVCGSCGGRDCFATCHAMLDGSANGCEGPFPLE